MGTAIEGNDPGFMNHLAVNQHIAGRLNNLEKAVVARLDAPDTSGTEAQASFLGRSIFGTVDGMKLTPFQVGSLPLPALWCEWR